MHLSDEICHKLNIVYLKLLHNISPSLHYFLQCLQTRPEINSFERKMLIVLQKKYWNVYAHTHVMKSLISLSLARQGEHVKWERRKASSCLSFVSVVLIFSVHEHDIPILWHNLVIFENISSLMNINWLRIIRISLIKLKYNLWIKKLS